MLSLEHSATRSVLEPGHHAENSHGDKQEESIFDSCAWGHRDPGSGKPYLKRQCIAAFASVNLSPLVRCCSCSREAGIHERIEGMTTRPGYPSKVRRSVLSGEYPHELVPHMGEYG